MQDVRPGLKKLGLERIVHEFDTRKALKAYFQAYNVELKEKYGAKNAVGFTLKGTHLNTAMWLYRIYEVLHNSEDPTKDIESYSKLVPIDGESIAFPVFKTNGAYVTECLGHATPVRFDEHIQRLSEANIAFRTQVFTNTKRGEQRVTRSSSRKLERIAINPNLIVYRNLKK